MTTKKTTLEKETLPITIIKQATAPKLTPKSDGGLGYEIGKLEKAWMIRVTSNSSGGFFSDEWVGFDAIEKALGKLTTSKTDFKSAVLRSVFVEGHSANNAGFLCACLRAEGLLCTSKKNVYLHQVTDTFAKWKKTLEASAPS